ncbi:Acyl-CoA synthetase short-chain family member 3, mitochondrial [Eumeta japonica]|uniref:acetate--CoA ligase n=1 Tax=Eumeta variegata TaxID=151549 RepID=A0A4C1YJI7_EUMVA|nr:Acyl-CoA synthetase short-chain family member 3, mitochondrial [Eumeta japonica]
MRAFSELADSIKLVFGDLGCGKKSECAARLNSSSASSTDAGSLISRLPTISLTQFSERDQNWLSSVNIFDSLVDSRTDLMTSQKFAYLLSCLSAEQRGSGLWIDFLNPLLMATVSLERLRLWPYPLLHIPTTKLSVELKTRFEQRYGGDPRVLPTFNQFVEFLEEECQLLDNIPREEWESSGNAGRWGTRRALLNRTTSRHTSRARVLITPVRGRTLLGTEYAVVGGQVKGHPDAETRISIIRIRDGLTVYDWYVGGELSVCHNALDRHVAAGRGDQVALIHDSPLTDTVRKITYNEMLRQV